MRRKHTKYDCYFKVEGLDAHVVSSAARQILAFARDEGFIGKGPIPLPKRIANFEKPVVDPFVDIPEVIPDCIVRKELVVVLNPSDKFVLEVMAMPLPETIKIGVGLKTKQHKRRKKSSEQPASDT